MTDPTRRPGTDPEPTEALDLGDLTATQVVDDLQATSVRVSPGSVGTPHTPGDFEATQVRGSPEDFEATRVQPSALAEGSTVRMSSEALADVHAAVDRALDTTDVAPLSQPTSLLPLHLQPISAPPISVQPLSVQPISAPPVSAPPQSFVAPRPTSRAPMIAAIVAVVLLLVLAAIAFAVLTRG